MSVVEIQWVGKMKLYIKILVMCFFERKTSTGFSSSDPHDSKKVKTLLFPQIEYARFDLP